MNQPKRILYRGVPMFEGWPEKIQAAQSVLSYTLNGKSVPLAFDTEVNKTTGMQIPFLATTAEF